MSIAFGVAPAPPDQAVPATEPSAYVSVALRAVRNNPRATGVIMLKKAMRVPGMAMDSLKASQKARKAWMTGLTQRAARGDECDKAALAALRNTQ